MRAYERTHRFWLKALSEAGIAVPGSIPPGMKSDARRCRVCGCSIYGRADKVYCSATCRRDACRVRERVVRLGEFEFFGRESLDSEIEVLLIPELQRTLGVNHRAVKAARVISRERRDAELEEMARWMRDLSYIRSPDVAGELDP